MGQSPLLRKAHLLKAGLSLIRSLMGQSPLFSKAHLPETCTCMYINELLYRCLLNK